METTKFVYFKEGDLWFGWLEEYPDYRTQGKTLEELKENLKDIYQDLTTGKIPHVRKVGELMVG
jgi:predicted RNase H-like HicB family nuclease